MIVLSDAASRNLLYPFTATRHVGEIRIGIFTIREKWEKLTGQEVKLVSEPVPNAIPANLIPNKQNVDQILNGDYSGADRLDRPWQIWQLNDRSLRADFVWLSETQNSAPIPAHVTAVHSDSILIEPGAKIGANTVLNAETGPIYIAAGAEIMEGCLVRGPMALCEHAVLKMGTKIYGATTLGPKSVGGGEIKNSVFLGYSNKGHEGYLGDSVLGEWCNLGAGTSNSNLKNTGGDVRYKLREFENETSGSKGGLLMGDYSRSAINTSFTTGTVVGVCCSIHQPNPEKFIPDFSWGNDRYAFPKILKDIKNWKKLKGAELSEDEIIILEKLYQKTL
jgi:UDP-N-acetylglucosamine diphosphorylase/glucosamine-1-phosphate N-acetyltransferase